MAQHLAGTSYRGHHRGVRLGSRRYLFPYRNNCAGDDRLLSEVHSAVCTQLCIDISGRTTAFAEAEVRHSRWICSQSAPPADIRLATDTGSHLSCADTNTGPHKTSNQAEVYIYNGALFESGAPRTIPGIQSAFSVALSHALGKSVSIPENGSEPEHYRQGYHSCGSERAGHGKLRRKLVGVRKLVIGCERVQLPYSRWGE
ncbi:hypothetical protein L227DRAFT_172150 [Lentinus tigrinus ALCF2SS1-6]|uniref:Uncharacterized protein n=1 Tax=Lentinus tigrinus ALCF2SS1-6 TaxID=1328759 RepID=A0A5C2S5Q5_9APHY|nr:hypothetical protein L227DRAFT_172150 [Lentinus tigrinus ALCF2SS1-6]